ncbi:MAG: T3SS effector HopA1 family protein [Dysgonomonas sp.]|uniref:T3SS effector HopA1 family protein n=1 Tax=Dysgonomonas sp. TaxID=1891233 RepID=UPI003A89AD65
MKTYSRQPETKSDTAQPKASQQASAHDILQTYKDKIAQRQEIDEDELLQGKFETAQPSTENLTGMPDNLKSGIESLSGYSMDDVRVHYNSSKPAQLQALAYAQGTDIHIAPGQEQHLPHEAWHVVQQKQGRVQPTTQLQGVNINDNKGLEKEADAMGGKAVQAIVPSVIKRKIVQNKRAGVAQCEDPPKAPKSSKEGLDNWIEYLYNKSSTFLTKDQNDIQKELYRYYSSYTPDEDSKVDNQKYIEELGLIENLSSLHIQGKDRRKLKAYRGNQRFTVYPQQKYLGMKKETAMQVLLEQIKTKTDTKWSDYAYKQFAYRAYNQNKKGKTLSRITLRLNPEKATEVFNIVSNEIVGSDEFPLVQQAKVMGPVKIQTSSDSLIIYVMSKDIDEIKRIIAHLTNSFDESYFLEGGPISMEPLGKGIYYAERAQYKDASGSHGLSRAVILAEAFAEMVGNAKIYFSNKEAFYKHIYRKFKSKGIDPNQPHLNLEI